MALLIPTTYNWIKDKGKAEGVDEGRKAYQKRLDKAYRRFGVEMDGHLVLPRTPEVAEFLDGEEPDDSSEE